jgi:hypothetical protein
MFKMDYSVCRGFTEAYVPTIIDPLYERYMNEDIICPYIGMCSEPKIRYANYTAWAENLLADKPAVTDEPSV